METIKLEDEKVIRFPGGSKLVIEQISSLDGDELHYLITTIPENMFGQVSKAIITNNITIDNMKLVFSQ